MQRHEERNPRIAFQTLGCKLNQYETDAIAEDFAAASYEVVAFGQEADVYVLNTCTVTKRADRKSRNLLYRSLRRAPLVVLTGCYAESQRRALADDYGDDDRLVVVDNRRKAHIRDVVEARRRGEWLDADALPTGIFSFRSSERFHTRATVKIQDGCDNYCSFCIVPHVRGRAVSRPADALVADAAAHIQNGMRELVLTGVNMSHYRNPEHEGGSDIGFSQLLERLLDIRGEFRLRISSLEPDTFDDRFFSLLEHPKMAPHLHLCLQSGSDRILRAMRRHYDTAAFREIVARIRDTRPDFNLTTDMIVGFPGEEEADFEASVEMAQDIGFSHIHTFPYSLRSRTRAANMPNHVPETVKAARAARLRRISAAGKQRYHESLLGREEHVLIERPDAAPGKAHGYGEHYVAVHLSDADELSLQRNQLVRTRLTRAAETDEPVILGHSV